MGIEIEQHAETLHQGNRTNLAAEYFSENRFQLMERIARKALLLGVLMIRRSGQGHAASTASAIHIMTAIYFSRGYDFLRFARGETACVRSQSESHKPHAVPGWNGLLYLDGTISLEQIKAFRTFHGLNAYPTHEDPGIQIPTGSLGMGPVAAHGLAFFDQYNYDHGSGGERGLQIATIGDSEFDEGVIHESLKERSSRRISGWIDIIDYNRQSLDGNLDERLVDRIAGLYESYGIPTIILKYGSMLQRLFSAPNGGAELRRRLDALTTDDYQALLRQKGSIIRQVMTLCDEDFQAFMKEGVRRVDDLLLEVEHERRTQDPELSGLFCDRTDREVKETFCNLGGHDLPMLINSIESVKRSGKPAAVIAYTVKGWGIDPLVGSLSGHWRQLSDAEIVDLIHVSGAEVAAVGEEWERFPEGDPAAILLEEISNARGHYVSNLELEHTRVNKRLTKALRPEKHFVSSPTLPENDAYQSGDPVSMQRYLGMLFGKMAAIQSDKALSEVVDSIVTMAADVAYTAGLSDWINRRGVWGIPSEVDITKKYREQPELNVQPRFDGQHIRLSNLEQFLGLLAAAFGKHRMVYGKRRFPFAFFYDVFLERFAEMFKYAAYWDSAVWFVGTMAGCSAPAESGLHHGFLSGVIGRTVPNVVTWEPAYPYELNWILAEEFRRAATGEDKGRRVRYLRVTATTVIQDGMLDRLQAQPRFFGKEPVEVYEAIRPEVLAGGYCLIDRRSERSYDPDRNAINIFAIGSAIREAIRASDSLLQDGIFANLYVVTSPNLLIDGAIHDNVSRLVPLNERHAYVPVLSITDSHPSYISGIASLLAINGRQPVEKTLGITRFDRSGTESEIGRYHGIHSDDVIVESRKLMNIPA